MDIGSIAAAYEGLKIGKSLLQAAYEHKAEQLSEEKIQEVMVKLGIAQDTLFQVREELFRLQSENSELKKKIDSTVAWVGRVSGYRLIQTDGGALVYESPNEPHHYLCPNCFEKENFQMLQDTRTVSGNFTCVSCGADYPVKPFRPHPRRTTPRGY